MNHKENRQEIGRRIGLLLDGAVSLPVVLRPYQIETLASMKRWLEDEEGTHRAYVSHATGLGKTILFSSLVTASTGLRSLIVVPSKVLIEQTVRELYKFTGGLIGHVSSLKSVKDEEGVRIVSERGYEYYDVVVITDASLGRHGRKLAKEFDPHIVIRDECHWTYAEKRQKVMDFYPNAVMVGFSATPDYLTTQARSTFVPVTLDNGQVLYAPEDRIARAHYGTCLDERTVRWGIEEGFLSPLAWGHVEFDISLDGVRTVNTDYGVDFKEEDLHALLGEKWQFMQDTIVELYKSKRYALENRQVFAVCHSVQAAELLAKAIQKIGIRSACITGRTGNLQRNVILSAFGAGEIKFLSSVMVLREGWNAPSAEVGLMLRPTKSRVFYVQSMGRVLRLPENGSHKVALVVDALYQKAKFAPLSAPVLFGYPGQEIGDGDFLINASGDASKVKESPYRTGFVKPKLITVEAFSEETELWIEPGGFVEFEEAHWYTLNDFSKLHSISDHAVRTRVKKLRLKSIRARDGMRRVNSFFTQSELEEACADLLSPLPTLGEDHLVEIDGATWAPITALAKVLELSPATIQSRVEQHGSRSHKGRAGNGRVCTVYALNELREACADLLEAPGTDSDGLLRVDEAVWGYTESLARILKLDGSTVNRILRASDCSTIEVRDVTGRKRPAYALADAARLCAYLQEEMPQAGKDGFFIHNNALWGTSTSIGKKLEVSPITVRKTLLESSCPTIKGRTTLGRNRTFYQFSTASELVLARLDVTGKYRKK